MQKHQCGRPALRVPVYHRGFGRSDRHPENRGEQIICLAVAETEIASAHLSRVPPGPEPRDRQLRAGTGKHHHPDMRRTLLNKHSEK